MSAIKRLLLPPLVAAARAIRAATPITRLWAHARLAAAISSPLDGSVVVLGRVEVHGTGRITLGRGLHLYRELYFETQKRGAIAIGDRAVISRGVHIVAFDAVRIGAGTMIGEYASLRDANHVTGSPAGLRDAGHRAAPITIGRNVWIGRGVTILGGVTIGDDAVVGANAVVTKNIPAGTTAVGVPARPLAARVGA